MKTPTQKKMKYIVKNEKILGGAPTIAGTRIPAERLVNLVEQGYKEKNIKKEFPGIRIATIRGALSELTLIGISHI